MEDLAREQDEREYLAGTWFRELAVRLATRGDLAVAAVSYDDPAVYELEVAFAGAPDREAIVIDRGKSGDHCQITLERWLPIKGEPGIEDAVTAVHAILTAATAVQTARRT